MRRLSIATALALFALGSAATASAQSRNCQSGNGPLGTVVGAVVGGAAGGAIANNTRGFRGNRGFSRRGFRGGRGFRGNRGFRRSSRGNQELGIILGALAGGIAGNQIANARTQNCNRVKRINQHQGHHPQQGYSNGQVLSGGPIDHNARRLGDPYGGRRVISQPTHPVHTSIVTNPVVQNTSMSGQFPITTQMGSTSSTRTTTRQGVFQPVCQNVTRTTRLPDGRVLNEPVEFCQFSQGGEWVQR